MAMIEHSDRALRAPRSRQQRLLAAVLAAAVGVPTSAEAIIDGREVTLGEQQERGLVTVGSGCSGILLSSDWVATAGHCVPTSRPNPMTTVQAAWLPGTQFQSSAIYQFADISQLVIVPTGSTTMRRMTNPGPEFALIHLRTPVPGVAPGYRMQLYPGTSASLVGATVAKYGVGWSAMADANPTSGSPRAPSGGGSYRAADLVVREAPDHRLLYDPNRAAQIITPGDSGGPGIVWNRGTPFLVGITSTASWDCFNLPINGDTDSAACRNSVFNVVRAHDVAIPAVRAAMQAVLRSRWDPGLTAQPVTIYKPEADLTDFPVDDVDRVHWAQGSRLGNKLCYNRGFSAGRLDGHQNRSTPNIADRTLHLQCSGTGAVWRDVTPGDMDGRWRFTDVNTVPWAQASRVAERLCQGFTGGFFTGHQIGNQFGLVCVRDGAQWFDAPADQIAAGPWGFRDINAVPWAQAARKAVEFCRGQGFSGGFMNGHQGPETMGVVCQR